VTNNGQFVPMKTAETRPASLREVMAAFATGVTVLTAAGARCHGMTANAFTSVSLDPPLVLCCVARTARMHDAITSARCFAVSLLGAGQEDVARYFSDKRRPRGLVQFDAVGWTPGPHTGAPLLADSLGWLECELVESYDGGDHSVFIGRVLASNRGAGQSGLVFFGGGFHQVTSRNR
jgi:flavin reductase (DIM6/NTAB) family NADH-FMN oxidoreductase RutF